MHGKIDECIQFAEDIEAYDKLIVHHINLKAFDKALEKIVLIKDWETRCAAMLKYSSTLIKYEPEKTLAVLIDKDKKQYFMGIDIPKLMPALRSVPAKSIRKAREYVMDQCSKRRTEKSVHNMAFYLFCAGDDVQELIEYLKGVEARKESGQPIFFEVDYALN